jgi:hypothetical protein
MPGRNGSVVMPQQTLNTIFEKLGNVEAVAREAKHAANNTSGKVDVVAGKVDALALVVATQGHLKEDVERLEGTAIENRKRIEELQADKLRRDGALGLFSWFSRNWPLTLMLGGLAALVEWANGVVK